MQSVTMHYEILVLVLLVILAFLQNWRATLVPATTVPITVIGAVAAMAVMGFSVNLLTLFAIVLCIGIVVDDAIVVVEGVAHKMEQGLPARPAATAASRSRGAPASRGDSSTVGMAGSAPVMSRRGGTGESYTTVLRTAARRTAAAAATAARSRPR
jgi:HAE1 family hydrophobic/amphiphilic exporter-1